MLLKDHKKPATNLPSAEQTPMGQKMARKGQATFDRYTYIAKANYEGSNKEVQHKASDTEKSNLLAFMHDLNKNSTDIGTTENTQSVSKRYES